MPTLSEAESKRRAWPPHGVPVLHQRLVATPDAAVEAVGALGYPVVAKLCGDRVAPEAERGLVRLDLPVAEQVRATAVDLLAAARPDDGAVGVLVAPMVRGTRELIAGPARDPQFGPAVMLGVGGVLAEAVADVAFRLVPLTRVDADELVHDLRLQPLLGPFRGEPPVDRAALLDVLTGLAALADADPDVVSVDVNAEAAVEASAGSGKPVLVATELATTSPDNPAPATVRATGRSCCPSAERAVTALDRLWRHARWRQRRGLG